MILVTGHEGFLGRHVIAELQRRFREQRDAEKGSVPKEQFGAWRSALLDRWSFMGYDLPSHTIVPLKQYPSAKFALDDWIGEPCVSAVIHLAAVADLNIVAKDPETARKVNVEGTKNVAECCAKHGKRLVYASTCCVYGNAGADGHELTEQDTPQPTEEYARQKLEGERLMAGIPGLRCISARLGTLYGPGMRGALFNAMALHSAMSEEELTIHGDGSQTRTYCYAPDAARALVLLAELDPELAAALPVNICGDEEISVNDSVHVASLVSGRTIGYNHYPDREGQIKREKVSNGRLRSLGWSPSVTFEQGMKASWEWLLAHPKGWP